MALAVFSLGSCGGADGVDGEPPSPSAPVAAVLEDRVALVGEYARFDATSSVDHAGGPLSYGWTLVREQSDHPYWPPPIIYDVANADGPTLSYLVPRAGSWRVTLTVTDRLGAAGTSSARLVGRHEFRDNLDGTATNLQTNLMWQLQDDGNLYTLAEARGRWVLSAGDDNGLDVCGNLSLAGYQDWRVPSSAQAGSLLDFTRSVLPFGSVFLPSTRAAQYYISDSFVPNSKVDYIYTADGLIQHLDAGYRAYLRCVRG